MESYSAQELIEIFKKKTREASWEIDEKAMSIEFMEKNKQYFKYAGGDMETLFVKCKIAHSKNLINGKNKKKRVLNEQDINDGLEIFVKNPIVGERKPEDDSNASWRTIYS